MRRCGNSKISNYRQNFLATLLHNGTFDLWWEELPDEEADEIIGFQGS